MKQAFSVDAAAPRGAGGYGRGTYLFRTEAWHAAIDKAAVLAGDRLLSIDENVDAAPF